MAMRDGDWTPWSPWEDYRDTVTGQRNWVFAWRMRRRARRMYGRAVAEL